MSWKKKLFFCRKRVFLWGESFFGGGMTTGSRKKSEAKFQAWIGGSSWWCVGDVMTMIRRWWQPEIPNKQPPGMLIKPVVNKVINYQPPSTGEFAGFLLSQSIWVNQKNLASWELTIPKLVKNKSTNLYHYTHWTKLWLKGLSLYINRMQQVGVHGGGTIQIYIYIILH